MESKKFSRYNKLPNHWNLEKTMSLYARNFDKKITRTWLVTEKIHGSNVCISNRYKEGPAFFTRNGNQLPPEYQKVLRRYNWTDFFKYYTDIDFAYGEIAGPGIQKGVNYGDKKRLYLFDICYSDGTFVTDFNRPGVTKPDGFHYAPVFYDIQASYEMILKLSFKCMENGVISKIYHDTDNVVEGFVLRCLSTPMLTDETRFTLKVKHPKFDEKVRGAKKKNKLEGVDFSPVEPYVNENRANSAMSKFPGYRKHQIGDVMREIVDDVKQEMKDDGVKWEKVYSKYINKNVSKYVVQGAR
jgi:hypothetical protein